jgi:phasin family protein
MAMDEDEKPAGTTTETAAQIIEQARGALEDYLDFFEKSMHVRPWAETDLSKKIQNYAGKNVATTFEFAQRLTQAKDLQDLVRIQNEFMRMQLNTLIEQSKDIRETAAKTATDALKAIRKESSLSED